MFLIQTVRGHSGPTETSSHSWFLEFLIRNTNNINHVTILLLMGNEVKEYQLLVIPEYLLIVKEKEGRLKKILLSSGLIFKID